MERSAESVCRQTAGLHGIRPCSKLSDRIVQDVGGSDKYQALCRSCHSAALQAQQSERAALATCAPCLRSSSAAVTHITVQAAVLAAARVDS